MRKINLSKVRSIIAVFLVCALISTLFFEVSHADHDSVHCEEENCPVCMIMQIVHGSFRFFDFSIEISKPVSIAFTLISILITSIYILSITPITQKTKLTI